jgi:hypothetical protein
MPPLCIASTSTRTMYVWQPHGLGLLYVFNLELDGELFLT